MAAAAPAAARGGPPAAAPAGSPASVHRAARLAGRAHSCRRLVPLVALASLAWSMALPSRTARWLGAQQASPWIDWGVREPPRRATLRPLSVLPQSADACAEASALLGPTSSTARARAALRKGVCERC